ncbi:hypothetical protein ATI61_105527 [Archangium gephyra]|uniref:BNR repeat domain protein n=1 Tax=Archangium gephyra TaxID=48 RepID=A0AAC8QEX5_9BACT|nr:tetratricopeptide repeat protein [Archangium gephyra]AKJ06487.1 BNR repeat domain protein [Archangium gephyra]REG32199.1 hypothetical protein ATI61_105527 [Archangium gephyra]
MLVLGLLACVPTQVLAAPKSPARKAPRTPRQQPPKAHFQSTFAAAVLAYENFEYEQALEQLTKAQGLAKGPEQEVPVALYLGIVHAELGDRTQSLAAFRTGLYLQPDARLPVKVSPKLERDFEEVRQAVLQDLGLPTAPVQSPPVAERPVQPAPTDTPAATAPPPPADKPALLPPEPTAPPAYVQTDKPSGRSPVLPMALLATGAVAGGAATFFGLQANTHLTSAQNSTIYGERVEKLNTAGSHALVANILFGTASAAAVGALAVYLFSGSPSAPASTSTGGASP